MKHLAPLQMRWVYNDTLSHSNVGYMVRLLDKGDCRYIHTIRMLHIYLEKQSMYIAYHIEDEHKLLGFGEQRDFVIFQCENHFRIQMNDLINPIP